MSTAVSPVLTSFRAMGTDCEVIIHGGPEDLDILAEAQVRELDASWSRFRDDSELCRLNAKAGTGRVPATTTMRVLVRTMVSAYTLTQGLCDASVLDSIIDVGYNDDFDAVMARSEQPTHGVGRTPPGLTGVEVGRDWVSLPSGVRLDSGAVGKGLAADLVAGRLIAAGAFGCAVNLGGDIVMAGRTIDDSPWLINVDDSRNPGEALTAYELPNGGAVATSSTLKRRWGTKHHIIDPRTGDSSETDVCQSSIIANSGWWAEAAATAALLLGAEQGAAFIEQHEIHGLLVTTDGNVVEV
jgi:thiamine biosynthesis lipoprotein